ncbi:hypothetical protein PLICRDRAFT_348607 [Plicaturopsis crispa FD-325 SS-3]|uniref:Uncharacterized protein n=1 Tax=Plicaturopsis crispa FD-325 SS-3 TaxID=944288 RepID=A0A0C9SL65_PLICR|nr:hypothetical protein PLICRDRAFT_348607 [Plicaturopsis crispa FD-325 SS-3]
MYNTVLKSQDFDLELIEELTRPRGQWSGLSRTFRCRLRAVDGEHSSILSQLPDLFVKLFDDRFLKMRLSERDRESVHYTRWLKSWKTAEDAVRIEASIYARLAHVQGSSLPRYFGSHLFLLPSGHEIEFIQSARYALRALQSADISQWDWHEDQLLLYATPTLPPHLTCVFIDFELAVQSDPGYDSERRDDYGELEQILCKSRLGLRKRLMEQYWEPREDWDIEYYTDSISDMKT